MSQAQFLNHVQVRCLPFRFRSFAARNAQVKPCQMAAGQVVAQVSGRKPNLFGFNSHVLAAAAFEDGRSEGFLASFGFGRSILSTHASYQFGNLPRLTFRFARRSVAARSTFNPRVVIPSESAPADDEGPASYSRLSSRAKPRDLSRSFSSHSTLPLIPRFSFSPVIPSVAGGPLSPFILPSTVFNYSISHNQARHHRCYARSES